MALTLQNSNLVWQKVRQLLTGASPAAQEAFRGLKVYFATQKKNPDLQLVSWTASGALAASGTGTMASSTGGVAGIAGTGTLYAVYAKHQGTGTTDAFFRVDDAINNVTGTAQAICGANLNATGDEFIWTNPNGTIFLVDLCVTSTTTFGGVTETTGVADTPHGFAILGA